MSVHFKFSDSDPFVVPRQGYLDKLEQRIATLESNLTSRMDPYDELTSANRHMFELHSKLDARLLTLEDTVRESLKQEREVIQRLAKFETMTCMELGQLFESVAKLEAQAEPAKQEPEHRSGPHTLVHNQMLAQLRESRTEALNELQALREQLRWRKWPEEKPEPEGGRFEVYCQYFADQYIWKHEPDLWEAKHVTHFRPLLPGPEES